MSDHVSRRAFLRTGLAAAAVPSLMANAEDEPTGKADKSETAKPAANEAEGPVEPTLLAKRKLGKTGVEISILGQGAAFDISDRHMNLMHAMGIRFIDTAKVYLKGRSEKATGTWLTKSGHRKDYFLVTKDVVHEAGKWMASVDERLKSSSLDYIDAFYLHGLGDEDYMTPEKATKECLRSKEWWKAAEAIKKSGKCKFVGFSTHTTPLALRTELLKAAAEESWVDVIMVAADPVSLKTDKEFNKAIDACHKAGIGLISMKECYNNAGDIDKAFPKFKEMGLNKFTAILTYMWTDERFTAICSHMDNLDKLRENVTAAQKFKPLTAEDLAAVEACIEDGVKRLCLSCDGSCKEAARTSADLNRVARYVNYAEHDGRVYEARDLLLAMKPELRDWRSADLIAATKACKCKLDFAAIVRRAEELMA